MIANVGTPLIWAGAFHLFAGNLLIGLLEGALFARLTKCSYGASILCLVLANYLSTWCGLMWFFNSQKGFWDHITVENLCGMFALQIGVAFLGTISVEFPLAFWASRWAQKKQTETEDEPLGRSPLPGLFSVVKVHFLTQAVSYLVLFAGYWYVSETSVMGATVVAAEDLLPAGIEIFYISEDGRLVYRHNSATSTPQLVTELQSGPGQHCLLMERSEGEWQVVVSRSLKSNDNQTVKVLASGFPTEKCPLLASGYPLSRPQHPSDPAPRLGTPQGEWDYSGDIWGNGLTARRFSDSTREEHRIGFSSPLLGWVAHEVTTLPNQVALFRFGPRQICLYDPVTNRVALFAKGRSVLAVLE